MKFFLLLTALACLTLSQVKAQDYDDRLSHLGIKVAANINALSNSSLGNKETPDIFIGLAAGVFYEAHLWNQFYIQPELNYSQKGGASSGYVYDNSGYNSNEVSIDSRQDLRYISLPILFEARSPGRGMYGVYIGPEFNYLLSNRQTEHIDTLSRTTNLTSSTKKFDLAFDFGVNYRIYRGLGVDIRYSYGFTNIIKPGTSYYDFSSGNTEQNAKLKTRVFQIDLFCKF